MEMLLQAPSAAEGARVPTAPSMPPVPRVVALGGGTGVAVLLRGLKQALFPAGWPWVPARDQDRLTAIVTAADDGGSSGRLRAAYRMLPLGDIRSCLVALSDASPALTRIFDFRFNDGGDPGVGGHSLGNLILAALSDLESDVLRAVECANRLLAVRGWVLPATLDDIRLVAEFTDGSSVVGESRIASMRRPIHRVRLVPGWARAVPEARQAIESADVVVLGPGSLYTSIIPVLLVRELGHAIARSRARVVLVMNLMSEPGETDGYTAADVVRAIRGHAPEVKIDDVLLNDTPISRHQFGHYAADGAAPIPADEDALEALGCRPVARPLLGAAPLVRHDPDTLSRAVLDLASAVRQ
jgi:uncharacterized cofD-like protein